MALEDESDLKNKKLEKEEQHFPAFTFVHVTKDLLLLPFFFSFEILVLLNSWTCSDLCKLFNNWKR